MNGSAGAQIILPGRIGKRLFDFSQRGLRLPRPFCGKLLEPRDRLAGGRSIAAPQRDAEATLEHVQIVRLHGQDTIEQPLIFAVAIGLMLLLDHLRQTIESRDMRRIELDGGTEMLGGGSEMPTPLLGDPEQLLNRGIFRRQALGFAQIGERWSSPAIANGEQTAVGPGRRFLGNQLDRLDERRLGDLRHVGIERHQRHLEGPDVFVVLRPNRVQAASAAARKNRRLP